MLKFYLLEHFKLCEWISTKFEFNQKIEIRKKNKIYAGVLSRNMHVHVYVALR
jgi:hypothetical protein